MRSSSKWLSSGALALAAFLVAACSSAAATPSSAVLGATALPTQVAGASDSAAMGSGEALVLQSNKTPAGTYLSGVDGKTLYFFAKDAPDQSNCTAGCATMWPPLVVAAGQKVQGPPEATLPFATINRPDGTTQVTYNHLPLYYYSGDVSAGGAMGQGLNGVWWIALVTGALPSGVAGSGAGASPAPAAAATKAPKPAPTGTAPAGYSY